MQTSHAHRLPYGLRYRSILRLGWVGAILCILLSCQGPMGDRHDLEAFRVAAFSVDPAGGPAGTPVTTHLALVVDGKLYTDAPVSLVWHWVEPTTEAVLALSGDTQLGDAVGPRPELTIPETNTRLALIATAPSGEVRRAYIDVPEEDVTITSFTGIDIQAVTSLQMDILEDAHLDLAYRGDQAPSALEGIDPGDALRLTAKYTEDDSSEHIRTRWMATSPFGTFLELNDTTTDWLAGILTIDDEKIEEREPIENGPITFLVLSTNDLGGVVFYAQDLWIGSQEIGISVNHRWLSSGTIPDSPWIRGQIIADDLSPTGLGMQNIESIKAPTDADMTWGTEEMTCAVPLTGAFDPNWLLEGLCTREDVVGHTVEVSWD